MPQDSNEHLTNATPFEDGADVGFRQGSEHLMSMEQVRAMRMVKLALEAQNVPTEEQMILEYLVAIGPRLKHFRVEEQGGGLAEVVKLQTASNYKVPSSDKDMSEAA